MSFLKAKVNLDKTPFKPEHLLFARSFFNTILRQVNPTWKLKPQGLLGRLWNSSDVYAICYLIELAYILNSLNDAISKSSKNILTNKLKEILVAKNEKQYLELLVELKFGALLSQIDKQITMEPSVLTYKQVVNKPPSPDYSFSYLGSEILVDITVLYVGQMIEWEESAILLGQEISKQVFKNNQRGIIRYYLPFPFKGRLSDKEISIITHTILSKDQGDEEVFLGDKTIKIVWKMPIHYETNELRPDFQTGIYEYSTYGPKDTITGIVIPSSCYNLKYVNYEFNQHAAVFSEYHLLTNIVLQTVKKSIENKLRGKKYQFPSETKNILVISIGQEVIKEISVVEAVNNLLATASFKRYGGIGIFTPSQVAIPLNNNDDIIHKPASCKLIRNPNSRNPIS